MKALHCTLASGAFLLLNTLILPAQMEESWKASPGTVESLSRSRPEFNYYEEKVPAYTLPDVLSDASGKKITSTKEWMKKRRPELLEIFRDSVYGRIPETPYSKTFKVINQDKNAMGGAATLKQVDITISAVTGSLIIHLTLFVPNSARKPVPVFLLINIQSPEIADPTRQKKSESWPAEEVIARGYAIAVFNNSDVDPDNYDEFRNGIHGLLDQGKRNDNSWGTIAAWAWGASRCMDYFETDKDINKKKAALVGHSRGGKTALWAGAYDQRFSMVVANESGCGGAALARRRLGETVARINTAFPHWFCTNYKKYAGREDEMPFDMHMLLALIAPRALYIDAASDDLWGDPKGCYLSLYNALPVYRLLKAGEEIPEAMPPLNKQIISGKVGFHIRDGAHDLKLKDWIWFMDFADKVWK
jgi:(4-O-methyl)-D-glucuronate---lignin esterase